MNALHEVWFLLVGVLLVGYAILDGFDLGVGTIHFFVARDDEERRTVLDSIGPVWDGNEVWLLTAGGALFAAFPAVYATVFSGFYLALVLLLVALIFRAVALEFRGHLDEPRWRTAWDVAFSVGSVVPALLLGVAVGNLVRGLPLAADGLYHGGLIGLLDPFTLVVGVTAVAMVVMHGGAWLALKTEGAVQARARLAATAGTVAFGLLWLVMSVMANVSAPDRWANFGSPVPWLAPAVLVVAVVGVLVALRRGRDGTAFGLSALAIGAQVAILGLALHPNLVPSTGAGVSLTVDNASSSDLTLSVMLAIALIGMPIVLAYTAFIYRRFWGKVPRGGEAGY